jgi:hypothetical protein
MRILLLFFPILLASCTTSDASSSRFMKIIILFLVAGLSILIKNYVQSRQKNRIYEVQAVNVEQKQHDPQETIDHQKSENILIEQFGPKDFFLRPILVILGGSIFMAFLIAIGAPFWVSFGALILSVVGAYFVNRDLRRRIEYSLVSFYSDRLVFKSVSSNTSKEILFHDVKQFRMVNIYEDGNYGIQHKMGTNMIFMDAESKAFFSFDYTLLENHTKFKKLLLDKMGIRT